MGKQLKLSDEYIEDVKKYFIVTSMDANNKISKLLSVLNDSTHTACIDGTTADALKNYVARAENLKDVILKFGKKCEQLADEFQKEIDDVDGDLYN